MLEIIQKWDAEVLLYIQEHLRTSFWNVVMPAFTMLGNGGICWVILIIIFLLFQKTRKVGGCCCLALLLEATLCNVIIKPLVARIRPYEAVEQLECLVGKQVDYSMPSGHTAAAFAFATGVYLIGDRKSGVLFLLMAGALGWSRLYVGVHYPTDVLVGAVLGIACGFAASLIVNWKERKKVASSN